MNVARQPGHGILGGDLRGQAVQRADGVLQLMQHFGRRAVRPYRIGLARQRLDGLAELGEILRRGQRPQPIADFRKSVLELRRRRTFRDRTPVRLQALAECSHLLLESRNRTRRHGVVQDRANLHEVLAQHLCDFIHRRRCVQLGHLGVEGLDLLLDRRHGALRNCVREDSADFVEIAAQRSGDILDAKRGVQLGDFVGKGPHLLLDRGHVRRRGHVVVGRAERREILAQNVGNVFGARRPLQAGDLARQGADLCLDRGYGALRQWVVDAAADLGHIAAQRFHDLIHLRRRLHGFEVGRQPSELFLDALDGALGGGMLDGAGDFGRQAVAPRCALQRLDSRSDVAQLLLDERRIDLCPRRLVAEGHRAKRLRLGRFSVEELLPGSNFGERIVNAEVSLGARRVAYLIGGAIGRMGAAVAVEALELVFNARNGFGKLRAA